MNSSSEAAADCLVCGQHHATTEPHVYDYASDVDDDLTCHICLQPFVEPTDLPCGHTLCSACLSSYLRLHAACPIDRLPLAAARCGASSLVLRRILEKLPVKCPNTNVCTQVIQRGDLEDHLKSRCKGATKQRCTPASPPPSKVVTTPNTVDEQQSATTTRATSITRLPVLEGEISHIEIPRVSTNLGITIVGGADTALRCVVVQEVFADGLVAQDGRLRPGDQLIEINGVDMTNASHHQACQALRKVAPVLRLGVYRERIEAYTSRSWAHYIEEVHTVRLERQPHQQLGVRLSGWWIEPGIYVLEVMEGSPAAASGRLEPYDRIVSVNGEDVASCRLDHASQLIQSNEKVTLVIARKKMSRAITENASGTTDSSNQPPPSIPVFHGRTKSAPESLGNLDPSPTQSSNTGRMSTPRAESYDSLPAQTLQTQSSTDPPPSLPPQLESVDEISGNVKRIIRVSGHQLHQKTVTINKEPNESLGMRIGGGLGSNEGNIPIYIANIHPQGCVGRTQQIWKGDILLDVNGTSLIGLTHSQAVATLKSTVENVQVTLGILEGPETSHGSLNFIPSWLYWQKLPRCLQFPKTVVLHRSPGASLGFSIVGGEDPVRGPESIHILFVVQDSPAAKDGKLRCGDRLLAVDGYSLENVKHSTAVSMLKQTGSKVTLEVVSWLGTEL